MVLFENLEYKRVAYTKRRGVEISTVWLGLAHGYGPSGPLIFETMTFGDDEQRCARTSSYEQAIATHKYMVSFYDLDEERDSDRWEDINEEL